MARILVTDGDQRSTLAAVRSLGRAGHTVLVAGTSTSSLASASRHCDGALAVPDPLGATGDHVEAIRRAVDTHRVDMLVPMTDRSATVLLELRDERPALRLPFPDRELYLRASDKHHLTEIAPSLDVPVPDQVVLHGPEDGSDGELDLLGWPLVLKPWRSCVRTESGLRTFEVRIVGDAESAAEHLASLPPAAFPVLAQRRVTGPGLGVFLLSREGETRAAFAHRRLREKPPTGGVSTYRESVAIRPDLLRHAERLLGHLGWTGVAMVEFKEDAATGTPYLMEINARLWGSLQLAVDAGVDFPRLMATLALEGDVAPVTSYRQGIRSRWLWGDVDHLLWMLRAERGYRRHFPQLPSRLGAVGRFLVPWRPGDRWEVLRPSDPAPFLRETRLWFRALRR